MSKLLELQKNLEETYRVGRGWGLCVNFNKMRCGMDGKLCKYDYLNPDERVEEPHPGICFTEPEIPNSYFAALIQWANRR